MNEYRSGVHDYTGTFLQAKSEDYRLLTHPVVHALLHYKWVPYGFAYYLTNLFIFLLFLVFATSFSLTLELPFSQDCKWKTN